MEHIKPTPSSWNSFIDINQIYDCECVWVTSIHPYESYRCLKVWQKVCTSLWPVYLSCFFSFIIVSSRPVSHPTCMESRSSKCLRYRPCSNYALVRTCTPKYIHNTVPLYLMQTQGRLLFKPAPTLPGDAVYVCPSINYQLISIHKHTTKHHCDKNGTCLRTRVYRWFPWVEVGILSRCINSNRVHWKKTVHPTVSKLAYLHIYNNTLYAAQVSSISSGSNYPPHSGHHISSLWRSHYDYPICETVTRYLKLAASWMILSSSSSILGMDD